MESGFDALRTEIARRLEQTGEELLALVESYREDAEAAAPAPEPTPARDLRDLRAAMASLDGADSQAEILARLLEVSGSFAHRTALLLATPEGLRVWSSTGFAEAHEGLDLELPSRAPWNDAQETHAPVQLTGDDCEPLAAALGSEAPAHGILVPMVLRDEVPALLYADRSTDETIEVEALQILTYTASQCLETLPLRSLRPASTLRDVADADASPATADESDAEEVTAEVAEDPIEEPSPVHTVAVPTLAAGVASLEADAPDESDDDAADETASEETETEDAPLEAAEDERDPEDITEPIPLASVDAAPASDAEVAASPEDDDTQDAPEDESADAVDAAPDAEDDATAADPDEGDAGRAPVLRAPDLPGDGAPEGEGSLFGMAKKAGAAAGAALAAGAGLWGRKEGDAEDDPPRTSVYDEMSALESSEGETRDEEPAPETTAEAADEPAGSDEASTSGAFSSLQTQVIRPTDLPPQPEGPPSPFPAPPPVTPPPAVEPPSPEPPAVEPPAASGQAGPNEVLPPDDLDEGPGWAFTGGLDEGEPAGAPTPDGPLHDEARRLARLLVSEIKLYNEEQIEEGRLQGNIYEQLRDDIDRSRRMYEERIDASVRESTDYFRDELVRSLADGDAQVMGL